MARKFIFSLMLMSVLSAGAISFKQISTVPQSIHVCSSAFCTAANPGVCGVCICNLPQGVYPGPAPVGNLTADAALGCVCNYRI